LGAAHTAATFFEGREGRKKQGANAVGGGDRDPEARRNQERRPRRHRSPHQPYPDVLDIDYATKEEPESSLEGARPDQTPSQTDRAMTSAP